MRIRRYFLILFLIALSSSIIYLFLLIKDLPRPDQIGEYRPSQSTKIYDRTGKILLYEIHGEEKRSFVSLKEIPEFLKWATIVAEDIDFYNHPAFDLKAILRALIHNLKSGQFSQGGSTITQQLAKNLFLTPEKTLKRKIKEVILALELESIYSKDQILELYLNQIPYGSNAYGVEAASQTFFNKSVKDLTLAEAAILASLPQAPTYYSPWGPHQKELFKRQRYILERMKNYGYISKEDFEKALAETKTIKFTQPTAGMIKAPHFVLTVKDLLIKKYGEEMVEKGGLKVITTLDWEFQQIAEKVVKEGAKKNEELYQGRNAALVAQDPKTGQILALVGSRDWYQKEPSPSGCSPGFDCGFEPKFNVPLQGLRQPGSALKPFVYLTAFKKGFLPKSLVFDVPTEFTVGDPQCPLIITPSSENNQNCFNPENFDNKFRGPVSFAQALAQSINVPSVKVLYLAGMDEVLKTLADFGLSTLKEKARYGLSLVLGGGEVKLIELVNAYATLAQEGLRHEQSFILEVRDSKGNILEKYQDKTERVIDPQYPRLINQILSDPELRKDLFQNSLSLTVFPGYEVALKTGTTNDFRDAWALGYTPSLVVGVWAGNNDQTPMERYAGSILAAVPIWSAFLKEVLPKFPQENFNKPEPIPENYSKKPMLNGQLFFLTNVNGQQVAQVHEILFYVDKKNPLGPIPDNPAKDPQFYNWEIGVIQWAKANIPGFNELTQTFSYLGLNFPQESKPPLKAGELMIKFLNVNDGDFIKTPFELQADLRASFGLETVELYWNHQIIERRNLSGVSFYRYTYKFYRLKPQNLLEIKIIDQEKNAKTASVLVFSEEK